MQIEKREVPIKSYVQLYYLSKGQENHNLTQHETVLYNVIHAEKTMKKTFHLHLGTAQIGM